MNTNESYTTREGLLDLLSDDEVARVCNAETGALSEGDEYVDLTRIDRGVQRADGVAITIGHVLPKKAVRERTWSNILSLLTRPLVS